MPSRAEARRSGWSGADFTRRADPAALPELMDEPCSTETLLGCLRNLQVMNRLTLSYWPTLHFLTRVARRQEGRELHIVDVGSGYGDMLRVIYGWAKRRKVRVRLTGIDLNSRSAEMAREATRNAGMAEDAIEWRTGDAMSDPTLRSPDVVLSSLVTHHMEDEEIVRFVRWMEASARAGWFVNDLERQKLPAIGFSVLATLLRWHPFLHHDGPVSFRRALRAEDWEALLREADVPLGAAKLVKRLPARLCVERLR